MNDWLVGLLELNGTSNTTID